MKTVKTFLLGIVVIGISMLLFKGALNYAGVCLTRFEKLSDKELVTSAITIVNNYKTLNMIEEGVGRVFEKIPYASVDTFLTENPNCCHVTIGVRTGDDYAAPGSLSRIFGRYRGDVNISYVVKYLDEGKLRARKIDGRVPLDNCGSLSD